MGIENRNFSIPKTPFGGSNATIMVATEPQRNAPKLSKSLGHTPLCVNNRVQPTLRRQSIRTVANIIVATAAILTGGVIYVLWRSDSLSMFAWFNVLGIEPTVGILREHAALFIHTLPYWVVFSLPQALWLFSGILFFSCIWHTCGGTRYMFWTGVFVAIAFGFEFGQLLNIVPGCFDVWDVLSLIAACLLSFAFLNFTSHRKRRV